MPDDNLTPIEEEGPLSPELPAPECDQVMSAEVDPCPMFCLHNFQVQEAIIGASLSKPHTSGTALQKCVCNLRTYVLVCLQPLTGNLNRIDRKVTHVFQICTCTCI